ncbi:unnamed protein product [Rotaria magnacalcarata]|uniref:Uncharacterized protein n=1 Tax=Rotaria magnacalcarata TaxID=392030 RepID=A0A816Y690_9BILA|nr:unnamed protein product [Rotaria magnacalcarata]CAF2086291.1 unnamed protein product [Rotaria magnacalcarata]CAF2155917.1 unnamed protein product [Rotaria magnacalcarata]CAF2164431.1 unnamed protein product [Rotaria magnacalcarata]
MIVHQYRLVIPTVVDEGNSRNEIHLESTGNHSLKVKSSALLATEEATKRVFDSPLSKHRWWLVIPCLLIITPVTVPDTLLMNDFMVRRYEHLYRLDSFGKGQRRACRELSTSTLGYWYLQQYSSIEVDYNIDQQNTAEFNVKKLFYDVDPFHNRYCFTRIKLRYNWPTSSTLSTVHR